MDSSILTLPDMLALWQETLNWQPNLQQTAQFQQLYDRILAGNRQLNLTRITEPTEFWEKHLWDSLRGVKQFLLGSDANDRTATEAPTPFNVIDIGTGAGLPGIAIAIALPHWTVTLLDSTQKKMNFVQSTVEALALQNTSIVVDRAEQVGSHATHRESYNIALVRAVATATVCAEYALPLLKQNGLAVLYRGQWTPDETAVLASAVKKLGGEIEAIEEFTTPLTHNVRHCLFLRKVSPTPQEFPRAVGIPTQKPLE